MTSRLPELVRRGYTLRVGVAEGVVVRGDRSVANNFAYGVIAEKDDEVYIFPCDTGQARNLMEWAKEVA